MQKPEPMPVGECRSQSLCARIVSMCEVWPSGRLRVLLQPLQEHRSAARYEGRVEDHKDETFTGSVSAVDCTLG